MSAILKKNLNFASLKDQNPAGMCDALHKRESDCLTSKWGILFLPHFQG